MRSTRPMITRWGILLAVVLVGCAGEEAGAPTHEDWPMYRGDLGGTGYSPLTQITTGNVADLTQSWSYSLRSGPSAAAGGGQGGGRNPNSQATPIVVGDVMYLPGVDRVVALDPTTGAEIWRHAVVDGAPSRRGVAYWPGEDGTPARVIFTAGVRLVALDAATGTPAAGFGQSGEIDMGIPYNSVPLVYENIVVVGANTTRVVGVMTGCGTNSMVESSSARMRISSSIFIFRSSAGRISISPSSVRIPMGTPSGK